MSFSSYIVSVIMSISDLGTDEMGLSAVDRTSGGLHVCDTV